MYFQSTKKTRNVLLTKLIIFWRLFFIKSQLFYGILFTAKTFNKVRLNRMGVDKNYKLTDIHASTLINFEVWSGAHVDESGDND